MPSFKNMIKDGKIMPITPPPSEVERSTRVDRILRCPFNAFSECYQDNCACWDTYRLMCSRK